MSRLRHLRPALFAAAVAFGVAVEPAPTAWLEGSFVAGAEARVGRPITPISYAGVTRRTTRRVVRRSTVYVATLPRSCVTVAVNGASYYQCGATYYQPYGAQYVVVYID